jgi:hypothetical protein
VSKRLIVPAALLVFLGLAVWVTAKRDDGGVRVQAGGPSSTDADTTTTQTPVTTSTTEAPTTAPTTSTTVTPVTEPTTTIAPDPTTTEPQPQTPPSTAAPQVAAQEVPQAAPVAVADPGVRATRSGPTCTTDPEYCNPPTTPDPPARTPWASCEQWHDLAAAVGWPESDGHTLSFVLQRESGCNPNAHNPSGATGLMQIIGGCAPYGSCYDPEANLRRGLDMRRERGWQPWQVCGFRRNC